MKESTVKHCGIKMFRFNEDDILAHSNSGGHYINSGGQII